MDGNLMQEKGAVPAARSAFFGQPEPEMYQLVAGTESLKRALTISK